MNQTETFLCSDCAGPDDELVTCQSDESHTCANCCFAIDPGDRMAIVVEVAE